MKVYVYPADRAGCGKYRMWWPAGALQAQGYDVTIVAPDDPRGIGGKVLDNELQDATFPEDADVIVLQRPCSKWLMQAIPFMQKAGVAVVVDTDDDLAHVHPSNPAFKYMHPKWSPMSNWHHMVEACKMADMVTVSTPALGERYGGPRSHLLRNCVPEAFLKVEHQDSDVVGWAGAFHSHPDDPSALGGALSMLRTSCRIIGPAEEGLDRAFGVQCEADGLIEFDDWPSAVTRLGIGLAPLADTRFNRAKSWLKPLEYASVGVPWVGSDLPEYRQFQALGSGGAIATKPKAWAFHIRQLRDNPSYRQEQSEAGRMVAAGCTIEEHAWRWMEAWKKAYDNRH